jgi:aspartate/methionine/tyrosine aminotransferase
MRIADRARTVSGEPFRLALKLPPDVIRLSVGEPDFETPEVIREAAKKAIDEGVTHYTPIGGFDDLRKAVAEKFRRDNNVTYDYGNEVLITPGSSAGIYIALQALLDPGDEVLVPDPGWFHYVTLIALSGGRPVPLPIQIGSDVPLDPNALRKKITDRTRVVILNSPSNPTGSVLTEEVIKEVGEVAEEHDLAVISDEIYERIMYDGHRHFSPASLTKFKSRTLTFNGFSKTYAMTGWRIGYVGGPSEIVEKITAINGYTLVCANSVTQRAALTALTDPQAEDSVKRMVSRFTQRRSMLLENLRGLKGIRAYAPQGAFYLWVDVSGTVMSGEQFSYKLIEEEKVGVLPGSLFGPSGSSCVRISFATGDEQLREAIRRFGDFVRRNASS